MKKAIPYSVTPDEKITLSDIPSGPTSDDWKKKKALKQIAANAFTDGGDFSASPAISDGQLFIRSTKKLYCIQSDSAAE